ncbi:MAG: molecular chaperone TorD family protein [Aliivibrio sp.]|uniref:TorD/DmsD family molecular chaperone n=1 Tax=Aliivibrio sp. TaxID=1872443 RepID=UPI001A62AC71|nr:molecular chaperone TorD family protein [Aliivibrio sp.]
MNSVYEQQSLRVEIYSVLARLYREAPDQDVLEWLQNLEVESLTNHLNPMVTAWSLLRLTAQNTSLESVEDEYQNIFIGIGRGEIVPFASWYLTGSLMEMPLAHLRNDLMQLGFVREESVKEPEDHFSALLEVMSMLADVGDEKEQQLFFNRHITSWYHRFCHDLKLSKSSVFYAALAELTQTFISIEQTRFIEAPQTKKCALNA